MNLEGLLRGRQDIWRGRQGAAGHSVPSGFPELDALLPGGGWPRGALVELLGEGATAGRISLLLPALARLSRGKRWIAWVAPPHLPYAPALVAAGIDLSRVLLVSPRAGADGLWALEQALRSGTCSAVLAWPMAGDRARLRRLQLAAEAGDCLGFLFCPDHLRQQPSSARLRLQVRRAGGDLDVQVLKRPGPLPVPPVRLPLVPAGPVGAGIHH